MKRGGNLKRTELKRKTPLRAKAKLSTKVGIARRKAQSAKRDSQTGPSKLVVALVFDRDGGCCIRCGTPARGERGVDYSIHHRAGRQMGGTKRASVNLPSNLVTTCGNGTQGCHGWIGANVAEAHRKGLLVLSSLDPKTVVLTTWWGDVLLDDEGRWTEVPS